MSHKNGRPRTTDYNLIVQKIQEGISATEIAGELTISTAQVYKVAKAYNIRVSPPKAKVHPHLEQIVQRVLETGNGYLVDREFGLSGGTAKKLCRRYGVDYEMRMGKPKLNRTLEEVFEERPDWKKMYEMHLEGQTNYQIADRFGVTQPSVNRVLTEVLGIRVGRGNHNPRKVHLPDLVGEMYLNGEGCKEIAEHFGISKKVVQKKLAQLNIPRRIGKASGIKNPQWKGGKEKALHKYRRQTYEVAAICLKKPVPEGHVIHHRDENPKNNHPSNLVIFPSASLHMKFHQRVLSLRLKVDSEEAIQHLLEIGGVPLPQPDFPIEF